MHLLHQNKNFYLLSGICVIFSIFFRFALVGYQTIALSCLGMALFFFCYGTFSKKCIRQLLLFFFSATVLLISIVEIPIVEASFGDINTEAKYAIVLGAGVNGQTPSLSLYHRLLAAKAWLIKHPNSYAILSGGQGPHEEISEAEAMYRWLISNGIEPNRLIKEDQSQTTQENFYYSSALLHQRNSETSLGPIAVISSEYHLYRAEYLAHQEGLQTVGVPAKTTLPILRINYFLRESIAVLRLWLFHY